MEGGTADPLSPPPVPKRVMARGTEASGKGRGRWIFVTHDILPDLGDRVVRSLRLAGGHAIGDGGDGPQTTNRR